MIQIGKLSEETRDSCIPKSVFPSNLTIMDLKSPQYLQASSLFSYNKGSALEANASFCNRNVENPFEDTFPDPLCKLNLRETSEFVKAFAMGNGNGESRSVLEASAQRKTEGTSSVAQRRLEAPPTPGRPVFSFSAGNLPRKSFPSKWDDAEKWVINSSCHDSPAHAIKPPEASSFCKQNVVFHQKAEVFSEKSRVAEEKVSRAASNFLGSMSVDHPNSAFNGVSAGLLLKDKFTDDVEQIFPSFRCSEAMKEGFLYRNSVRETMKDAATEVVPEVQHRDIGTEMTPLGSSTTSRCHTPIKSPSPARHNTPANREEEEKEVSKSLRHFEMGSGCPKSIADSRASAWEEEEKTKSCLRYQREEAKIQAWVNLQNAKAEAQSKKLEVKIQKMRSNLEEKLMKRMAMVHRKAEEWRAQAQLRHSQQIQKATNQAEKMNQVQHNSCFSDHTSCGCFPCNNHHP
ncbi:uncharacterized protein LOC122074711 isoform X2 [Macadamia integrifolia]|uniref:uncharacterized protein LOC122074711 isoform X2 n=1 Tax=Macadamia integrifolia TaxID=60698 RepID=UPI001C4FACB3|nr:uncharacterized protein LOC122074711 isoform X2 [Macadamia integrifolia]